MSDLGRNVADILGILHFGAYHLDEKTLKAIDWKNERWMEIKADSTWCMGYEHNSNRMDPAYLEPNRGMYSLIPYGRGANPIG